MAWVNVVIAPAIAGVYNRVETQPGLDQFADDPAQLADVALGPLLAWARAVVPVDQHTSSPVFLMGTGGLRRLQDSKRQLLMQHVRNTLSKSGFRWG
jgi:Golgi nucleoside diphosphatase